MVTAKKKKRLGEKHGKRRPASVGETVKHTDPKEPSAPPKTFRRSAPRQPKILAVLVVMVTLWVGLLIYLAQVVNT